MYGNNPLRWTGAFVGTIVLLGATYGNTPPDCGTTGAVSPLDVTGVATGADAAGVSVGTDLPSAVAIAASSAFTAARISAVKSLALSLPAASIIACK